MIDQEEATSLYEQALAKWGTEAQIWMAVEESGEFLAALSQTTSRGREADLVGEIADLSIMLEQLAIIFGKEKVEETRQRKLRRLKIRLNN